MPPPRLPLLLALVAAPLLSACAPQPTTPAPGAAPAASGCQAKAASLMVGQLASPALLAEAQARAGARAARTLKPDQLVTMEFDGTRLNLVVDASNRVRRVYCG